MLKILFRSKSSDRSPDQIMQFASTERKFRQISENNFYDTVLSHGDGTLVNVSSRRSLKGNFSTFPIGFCICRYVDILSVSFMAFILCTTITSAIVMVNALSKIYQRQRHQRRVDGSQVNSEQI